MPTPSRTTRTPLLPVFWPCGSRQREHAIGLGASLPVATHLTLVMDLEPICPVDRDVLIGADLGAHAFETLHGSRLALELFLEDQAQLQIEVPARIYITTSSFWRGLLAPFIDEISLSRVAAQIRVADHVWTHAEALADCLRAERLVRPD